MNKRKFLLITSIVLIGFFLLGNVYASSNSIELDGVKFNIPDGYSEIYEYAYDGEVEHYSSFDVNNSHRAYEKGDNYLGITVSDYSNNPKLEDLKLDDEVSKEIGGTKGLYAHDDLHFFTYEDDGKIIMISADDYSIIEEVIDTGSWLPF